MGGCLIALPFRLIYMALHNGVQGFYITAGDIRRKDHIMRKTIKTKDDVAKEKEQEMAKLKQDEFYAEPDEPDNDVEAISVPDISVLLDKKIPLQPEFQLIYDIASQLAAMTALKLDKVLIQTSPSVAKELARKLEDSDGETMVSTLQAIFLVNGMVGASEDLNALRLCKKYDDTVYMFFQDEILDTEIFDWCRIDEMFRNYYEKSANKYSSRF